MSHTPPTGSQLTDEQVAKLGALARRGVSLLVIRTIIVQLTVFGGQIWLARLLAPKDFGVFAIAQFALLVFTQLGSAGLGSALIQKEHEPTQLELSSLWWLQLTLGVTTAGLMWFTAPLAFYVWPDLPSDAIWLLRAMSLNVLFTALRIIPTMLLERHLHYNRLAVLEVLLQVPYYATAITLAYLNYGVMAFALALLAQGACSVVGAFALRPWMPSWTFDRGGLGPIVRFGANYQFKHIIGLLFGALTPVYVGRTLGQTQLGLLDWSQRTAFFPLRLVEVMTRVSFPLYSRLQNNRAALASTLERSLQISAMGIALFVSLMFALGPELVRTLYTDKWLPALPTLYVYAAGISLGFMCPLVFPVFDAMGKPEIATKFSISWTVGIIVLAPLMCARWGAPGFALGYCIPMVLGNLATLVYLKRKLPEVRIGRPLLPSAVAALAVVAAGLVLPATWAAHPLGLAALVVLLAALFLGVVATIDRTALTEIRGLIRKNNPG